MPNCLAFSRKATSERGEGGYKLLTEDWSKYDKYGGGALELDAVPLKELEKWQRRALLYFYVKNFRFTDLFKFIIEYGDTIFKLLLKSKKHEAPK